MINKPWAFAVQSSSSFQKASFHDQWLSFPLLQSKSKSFVLEHFVFKIDKKNL